MIGSLISQRRIRMTRLGEMPPWAAVACYNAPCIGFRLRVGAAEVYLRSWLPSLRECTVHAVGSNLQGRAPGSCTNIV